MQIITIRLKIRLDFISLGFPLLDGRIICIEMVLSGRGEDGDRSSAVLSGCVSPALARKAPGWCRSHFWGAECSAELEKSWFCLFYTLMIRKKSKPKINNFNNKPSEVKGI